MSGGPLRILNDEEVIRLFGDPFPWIRPDGSIDVSWPNQVLAVGRLPSPLPLNFAPEQRVTKFRSHYRVVHALEAALAEIHRNAELWATVNDWAGCYEFRANRKDRRKLSRHSWGIALDMDARDNPQGRKTRVNPGIIGIMESHGFAWGGYFKGDAVDGMHWEFARPELLTAEQESPIAGPRVA